jgi:hypothetical protein
MVTVFQRFINFLPFLLIGLAVAADENFKTFQAAYPYVVWKLLSDNSLATRRLLNQVSFIISFRTVCVELASEVGVVLGPSMGPSYLQSQSWTNIFMLCCPPCGLGCINVIPDQSVFLHRQFSTKRKSSNGRRLPHF